MLPAQEQLLLTHMTAALVAGCRPEDATFEQCFYMAGGQAALEEVEALGNEASRLCNRARRNLSPGRQAAFEQQITEFAPLFDLSSEVGGPPLAAPGATVQILFCS